MQYDGSMAEACNHLLRVATGSVSHSIKLDGMPFTNKNFSSLCNGSTSSSLACTGGMYDAMVQGAPGLPGISRGDAAAFILEGFGNTLRGRLRRFILHLLFCHCPHS